MSSRQTAVLLVEDDEIAAESLVRAFEKSGLDAPLFRATDGIEALKMLRGEGHAPVERPYIVLLDLNMPRMDGLAFLAELRADPELSGSVVFVLTTSRSDRDRHAAYAHQIAGYMVKSEAGADYIKVVDLLRAYWAVVLPGGAR